MTLTNTGLDTINITNMSVPAGYSFSDTTAVLAGGASVNINVTFAPTEHKNYNNSSFVFSDAASGDFIAELYGEGYDSTTSVQDDIEEVALGLYPNPTSGLLHVKGYEGQIDVLNVYNASGILVKSVNLKMSQAIDMTDLATGMYIVRSPMGEINSRVIRQ